MFTLTNNADNTARRVQMASKEHSELCSTIFKCLVYCARINKILRNKDFIITI